MGYNAQFWGWEAWLITPVTFVRWAPFEPLQAVAGGSFGDATDYCGIGRSHGKVSAELVVHMLVTF
jgi:hypothetical protein